MECLITHILVRGSDLLSQHIFDSVKASLKRLQLDHIDVLQCRCSLHLGIVHPMNIMPLGHRFDYTTPIEETMQALHDVVKAGYVRYIGMSSCHAYQCTFLSSIPFTTR